MPLNFVRIISIFFLNPSTIIFNTFALVNVVTPSSLAAGGLGGFSFRIGPPFESLVEWETWRPGRTAEISKRVPGMMLEISDNKWLTCAYASRFADGGVRTGVRSGPATPQNSMEIVGIS